MSYLRPVLPLAIACLLFALPDDASAQTQLGGGDVAEPTRAEPAPSAPSFDGSYRFVSGNEAIARSVNAVCDRLDVFTRLFARPILEDRNRPYDRVQLSVDEGVSRFSLGAWRDVATRFGAVRTVVNERGERVRVQQVLRGRRLVQTFTTDQGTRRNVLTLSPDGRRLIIHTRITSPRLPQALAYRLVYAREENRAGR